ncbi:MAG: response regulator transcription factor [Burkholderiales bacterium]|uniref:response regulator n=1 Tax=Inhella sp. TaxID=1921806 RepID=UPI001ACDD5DB|nr:response regulator transcription factor [Burkholderiales bacterium]
MKLLLVDDHPLIHIALRALLSDFQPPVQLLGAESAAQARAQLSSQEPDMLLLDLQLGEQEDGFALLDELRASYPAMPIVCISGSDQMADVIRAIDQGAMGFIPKHVAPEEFKQALLLVVSGGIYVPPMRMGNAPLPAPPGNRDPSSAPPPVRVPLSQLAITPRQHEVLQGLLQGKPNKLIASELNISAETVKDHVQAIYRALGVNSRTQAVLAVGQMSR